MAPLVKEFQQYEELFETRVCITAQHREMLDQVLHIFEIIPEYDLNLMKPGQDLYDITAGVLLGMRKVLDDFAPDVVLVHGDTCTSTAVALAAFYKQIPVGHVEAGLRTYNKYSPWPEEMNREITGRIATWHFAPTKWAQQNLLNERNDPANILITGNTVIDALHLALSKIESNAILKGQIEKGLGNQIPDFENKLRNKKLILVTGHRRENFGEGLIHICEAITEIALQKPESYIIYPVHLNPNVQKPVQAILKGIDNVFLLEPLEYLTFLYLMKNSFFILTDSGGIQEEAPALGKPVLVMRDTTERPEAVEAGTAKIVGADKQTIIRESLELFNNPEAYQQMSKAINPFGDGQACSRIRSYIYDHLKSGSK
jgi:UDP-N-acetylglucosamine 2-epimerase (non-hydrolysing)